MWSFGELKIFGRHLIYSRNNAWSLNCRTKLSLNDFHQFLDALKIHHGQQWVTAFYRNVNSECTCSGQMGGKKSISHSRFFALLFACWYFDTSARRTFPRDRLSTRLMKEARRKREREKEKKRNGEVDFVKTLNLVITLIYFVAKYTVKFCFNRKHAYTRK